MLRFNIIKEAYPHFLAGGGGRLFIPLILGPPRGFGVGTDAGKKWQENRGFWGRDFRCEIYISEIQTISRVSKMAAWYPK